MKHRKAPFKQFMPLAGVKLIADLFFIAVCLLVIQRIKQHEVVYTEMYYIFLYQNTELIVVTF